MVSISIYALGAVILVGFSVWAAAAYLLYCLWVEAAVLKRSCVNCYYYGKVCGLGKGKLCFLLRRRGDPQEFANKDITWLSVLPDFMIFLVPAVSGIILLVKKLWVAAPGAGGGPVCAFLRRQRSRQGRLRM